jgi:hypothetical protein
MNEHKEGFVLQPFSTAANPSSEAGISAAGCQLIQVFEGAEPIDFLDRLRLLFMRLLAALRRRTNNMAQGGLESVQPGNGMAGDRAMLEVGDWVQIGSREEIEKTLDAAGKTQGLSFLPNMFQFCDTTHRVLKQVHYIFDERSWKMSKCRNVVVLDGVYCDGKDVFAREGCDRCCFMFWKTQWLKKVSAPAQSYK